MNKSLGDKFTSYLVIDFRTIQMFDIERAYCPEKKI